jgi:Snf7
VIVKLPIDYVSYFKLSLLLAFMNCLLESVAGVYIGLQQRLSIKGPEDPLQKAREELEICKGQLHERAEQLQITATGLCQDALTKKRLGHVQPALQKFQEYKRCKDKLDKVTNGINLLNHQLDLLMTNDLDKQIMHSLKNSTTAMRAAGIETNAKEADHVMVDLEEQLRESENFTSILAAPLTTEVIDEDALEEELAALLEETLQPAPVLVSTMQNTATTDPNGTGVHNPSQNVTPPTTRSLIVE